jgi:AAA15 family ATPase/GTPase
VNLRELSEGKVDELTTPYSVQVDLDLPVIAVIGNQSAGKSSLIEAISGITLPRAAGTCTR